MINDHLNQCTMQCPSISWFYGKITSGMFKWFRVWIENDSSLKVTTMSHLGFRVKGIECEDV